MSKWKKLSIDFAIGIYTKNYDYNGYRLHVAQADDYMIGMEEAGKNAERLVSCWNACLNLNNPTEDLPKIIEALQGIVNDTELNGGKPAKSSIREANQALALIKEEQKDG